MSGASRKDDPDTSHVAASRVNVSKLQRKVLTALAIRPMTSEEAADHTGTALGSITPRMKPLRDAGLIERTDVKRTGASNTPRYVERITPKGRLTLLRLQLKEKKP